MSEQMETAMYATIDAEGRATAFYDPAIHTDIPEGAIEISETVHAAWIADTVCQRWDGAALVACGLPAPPPPTLYAVTNAEGRATGFYRSDMHAVIPDGAIEISEAVHAAWMNDTIRQRWDGAALVACDPPAAPPPTADEVRRRRDARLKACDWTQLPDSPLGEWARLEWATYRQALRNVPAQPGFPADVTWPVAPG